MSMLNVPCPGGHAHVRIEGRYTKKKSAIYHPVVAERIADCFDEALTRGALDDESNLAPKLESVIMNDVLLQKGWTELSSWDWKKPWPYQRA